MANITNGYLQIYTGNGKGKTTASLGLALRAITNGFTVAFVQFMKCNSERCCAERIGVTTYRSFGKDHEVSGWYSPRKSNEPIPQEIITGWNFARDIIMNGIYDIVILDEINVALLFNFVETKDLISTLQKRPKHVEIVCTGRGAPQELLDIADLVTCFQEIKHMYQKGVSARKGIDF